MIRLGLGRRTREEIAKWNQMTALRFQTGGTSDIPGERMEKKDWALRPQKPLRLIRDEEAGGSGIFISNTYSLHCHHQNDSALRWAVV